MHSLSPALAAHLASGRGLSAHTLFWVQARNRDTGLPETLGLWTGPVAHEFTVGGVPRTYLGAGGLIGMDALIAETGVQVRTQRVTLSPLAPEVREAILTYDARLAPVEVHVAYFDQATGALIDLRRVFKGQVDRISFPRAPLGGEAAAEVTLLSSAFALTRPLALRKSDAALRRATPGDGFRRYTDVSGAVTTVWGETRAAAPSGASSGSGGTAEPRDIQDFGP